MIQLKLVCQHVQVLHGRMPKILQGSACIDVRMELLDRIVQDNAWLTARDGLLGEIIQLHFVWQIALLILLLTIELFSVFKHVLQVHSLITQLGDA